MIQIRFIGDLDIQKIGIHRILIKIAVVNDTKIHLGIWYDDTAVIINISDNRITQIDGLNISGNLHPVNRYIYTVSNIKRIICWSSLKIFRGQRLKIIPCR